MIGVDRRVGDQLGGGGGVIPLSALALNEKRLTLREPVPDNSLGSVILKQLDVEADRLRGVRVVELGNPVLVIPAPAEGIDHGAQRSAHLAPAREASQTDAQDLPG